MLAWTKHESKASGTWYTLEIRNEFHIDIREDSGPYAFTLSDSQGTPLLRDRFWPMSWMTEEQALSAAFVCAAQRSKQFLSSMAARYEAAASILDIMPADAGYTVDTEKD